MRARNIKPSLYKNEILGTAEPLLTILFSGLWCIADREGRLEDRPLRIKAEIFPYRDVDVNVMLTELERLGFIDRYEVDGLKLIQVVNFPKHQHPHPTEKKSDYPPKREITVKQLLDNSDVHVEAGLIPDSLLLIPDSKNSLSSEPQNGSSEFELSPPKSNGKPDPRFKPAVDAIKAYWDLKNPDRPFVFGPSDGKQLKNFLRDCRQLTIEQFQFCLSQRAESQVVHSDRPCKWISDLMAYANGPLDKFKRPMVPK